MKTTTRPIAIQRPNINFPLLSRWAPGLLELPVPGTVGTAPVGSVVVTETSVVVDSEVVAADGEDQGVVDVVEMAMK